jgi:hypothetical protein
MPTGTFTGIALELESVQQTALATIRARFTQPPLASSSSGPHDALNPTLYTLSGPGLYQILSVGSVYGDPQAFDIFLVGPLASGLWTLTVSGALWAYDNSSIQPPESLSFNVALVAPQEGVNPGAFNDDAAAILRKHLNPALKGKGWDSTIAAIATGIQKDWDNGKSAFDQMFKISASGLYLERKAGDDGLSKPANIGMPDELFREYAIETTNDKLTENSLLKILEIFYGQDSVRASVTSSLAEPYSIQTGDELDVLIDEEQLVRVIFDAADFAISGNAKAIEVAAAITRACELADSEAFAIPYADPVTGAQKVRIYSGALGLSSSVRVTGGKAQNVLQFDSLLNVINSPYGQWTVTVNLAAGTTRYQVPTGSGIDLSTVYPGDYVNIFGAPFNALNRGSFTITNVYYAFPGNVKTQWFEVQNVGVAETPTQTVSTDVLFYRPVRKTIHTSNERAVIVSQPTEEVDIVLPATSQAVGRGPGTAAYNQVNTAIAISALERINGVVSVTTAQPHGLSVGGQVQIDGAYGKIAIPPIITALSTYEGSRSKGSIWSLPINSFDVQYLPSYTKLVKFPTGRIAWAGGLWVNHPFTVNLEHAATQLNVYDITAWTPQADGTIDYTFLLTTPGTSVATASPGSSLTAVNLLPQFASRLLYTGGWNDFDTIYNTAYLWDSVGAPVAIANMSAPRAAHAQSSLTNGKVIVTGGMTQNNRATNACELVDFSSGTATWSAAAAMHEQRVDHQQVALSSGKLLVTGGRPLAQGHSLDPDTVALWRYDSDISLSGSPGTADSSPNALNFVYNLTAPLSAINTTTFGESGNCLHVTGGSPYLICTAGAPVGATMDPLYNTFLSTESTFEYWVKFWPQSSIYEMNAGTLDGTAATNVLFGVRGTHVDGGNNDTMTIYWHHDANVAVQLTATVAELGGTSALFDWNHFTIVRTAGTAGTVTVKLYLNGALKKTWANQTLPNTTTAASGYVFNALKAGSGFAPTGGVTFLDDTRLSNTAHNDDAVFFGYQQSTGELYYSAVERIGRPLATCEIYDPNANTWTLTGPMAHARVFHKAVVLPGDKVMVIGGLGYDPTQAGDSLALKPIMTCEIWNPATGTWTTAGSLAHPRDSVIAEYLPSRNQIIVTGGSYSTTTEIFNVTNHTWRLGSAVLPYTLHHAMSVVTDHESILMIGGFDSSGLSESFPLMYVPNADDFLGGSLNGQFTVTSVDSSTAFKFTTPDELAYTLLDPSAFATATAIAAQASTIPGPFIWNPTGGVAITGTESTLSTQLDKGHQYKSIVVADATQFPDADGWLVLDFGRETQVAPLRYFGRLSATELAIDFSVKFPATVKAGANVSLLANKGPFIPSAQFAATKGSLYLTDSQAGRIAASAAIDASVAAGVEVNKTITYPGDRGLGGEGLPTHGNYKLSDAVTVWGSDNQDGDLTTAREE